MLGLNVGHRVSVCVVSCSVMFSLRLRVELSFGRIFLHFSCILLCAEQMRIDSMAFCGFYQYAKMQLEMIGTNGRVQQRLCDDALMPKWSVVR